MSKKTTTETQPADLGTIEPPLPPGGGSWTWDDTAKAWVSNDQPAAQNTEQE